MAKKKSRPQYTSKGQGRNVTNGKDTRKGYSDTLRRSLNQMAAFRKGKKTNLKPEQTQAMSGYIMKMEKV